MFDFLKTLFNPAPPSGNTAKERLRLVLLSDHLSLAPDVVDALKRDLLAVISRYVTIDSAHADVTFEHRDNEVAMMANIPITGVRERTAAERAALAPVPAPPTSPAPKNGSPVAVAERPIGSPEIPTSPSAPSEPTQTQLAVGEAASVVPDATNAAANGVATTSPAKTASRRRRRKKAASTLANAERKAPGQPQPGYSAQA